MTKKRREFGPDPIYQVADLLGDAWSWMILRDAIFDGVTRFDEFQQGLGVARKVLSKRLETLTAGGLFVRQHIRPGGARCEYVLTEMGRDFFSCLVAAMRWGEQQSRDLRKTKRRAIHTSNGHVLEAVLCCSECRRPLQAREVDVVAIHRASSELIGAKRRRSPDLEELFDRSQACPIARTLRIIGDRWGSLVIRECFLGTKRFGVFEKNLGIAPNILVDRLERLVRFGVLVKMPYQQTPMRLEYRLTEKGRDLYCVPLAMLTWAQKWLSQDRSKTNLRHKLCGKAFVAILTCATCGEKVGPDDVVMESVPEANHSNAPNKVA